MRTGNGLTLNDLEYSYTGNRIASIADAGAVYDYGYDANGNMTHDGANDLDITYNCLNMTQKSRKRDFIRKLFVPCRQHETLGDGARRRRTLLFGFFGIRET